MKYYRHSLFYILAALMSTFACQGLQANEKEPRHITSQVRSLKTSDKVDLQSYELKYESHRRNTSYPYEAERDKAIDYGLGLDLDSGEIDGNDLEALSFNIFLAKKFSKRSLAKITLGQSYLKLNQFSKNLFSPSAEWSWQSKELWGVTSKIKKTFLSETNPTLPAARDFISQSVYSLQPYINVSKKLKFASSLHWAENSDDNRQSSVDTSLTYAISVWPTWFRIGLGYEHRRSEKQEDYWSPRRFKSFGLRSEISRDLTENLNLSMALNINRIREEKLDYGSGRYFNMGLRLGKRNNSHLKINYENIKSIQSASEWQQNSVVLRWNLFF